MLQLLQIVTESEERLTEEQIQELLQVIVETLPEPIETG